MDPRDFCNWFQGVMDVCADADGGITFTKVQAQKINEKLTEALAPKKMKRPLHDDPNARC